MTLTVPATPKETTPAMTRSGAEPVCASMGRTRSRNPGSSPMAPLTSGATLKVDRSLLLKRPPWRQ